MLGLNAGKVEPRVSQDMMATQRKAVQDMRDGFRQARDLAVEYGPNPPSLANRIPSVDRILQDIALRSENMIQRAIHSQGLDLEMNSMFRMLASFIAQAMQEEQDILDPERKVLRPQTDIIADAEGLIRWWNGPQYQAIEEAAVK